MSPCPVRMATAAGRPGSSRQAPPARLGWSGRRLRQVRRAREAQDAGADSAGRAHGEGDGSLLDVQRRAQSRQCLRIALDYTPPSCRRARTWPPRRAGPGGPARRICRRSAPTPPTGARRQTHRRRAAATSPATCTAPRSTPICFSTTSAKRRYGPPGPCPPGCRRGNAPGRTERRDPGGAHRLLRPVPATGTLPGGEDAVRQFQAHLDQARAFAEVGRRHPLRRHQGRGRLGKRAA